MSRLIIQGGYPLHGVHRTPGNKNAALPMIAAATLAHEGTVRIRNLPAIHDVVAMLKLLGEIGIRVNYDPELREVEIDASHVDSTDLPQAVCREIRTSVLLAGPLVSRFGHVSLYPPGGDVIGLRRLDTHIEGLRAMGAKYEEGVPFSFTAPPEGLHGTGRYVLDEASVTGTENLVMAAVLARGVSELYNVACEPHIQDLCRMLSAMGARISGIGTNLLRIEGVRRLHGAVVTVGPDYIESASYLLAAAATGGSITIEPVVPADFTVMRRHFERLGVTWEIDEHNRLHYDAARHGRLDLQKEASGAIAKIDDGIWPALPSDIMSPMIVLATQRAGIITFFEKMFENRLYFVDRLIDMGAQIVHCDPHRVVVSGPCRLHASKVNSPDIRAGMAMVIAGLCAEGETVVNNAEIIDRGYETVEENLCALGAHVRRELIQEEKK